MSDITTTVHSGILTNSLYTYLPFSYHPIIHTILPTFRFFVFFIVSQKSYPKVF